MNHQGPVPDSGDLGGGGGGPKLSISSKLPGDPDAAGLVTTI